jgi:hypothetical protein
MSIIYCNINIFDYDQEIYLVKGENSHLIARVPFTNLGKSLPGLCYTKGVYDVHISCNIPGMARQAIQKAEEEEMKQYNASKINFVEG